MTSTDACGIEGPPCQTLPSLRNLEGAGHSGLPVAREAKLQGLGWREVALGSVRVLRTEEGKVQDLRLSQHHPIKQGKQTALP